MTHFLDNKILNSLNRGSMLSILTELCKTETTCKTIMALADAELRTIDYAAITDEVFCCLNIIDVVTLWENSGEGYYGYNEPTEVAFEMLEDAIEPYMRETRKRHAIGMHDEEKEYCAAIIRGALKYAEEGSNEFRGWVSDDLYILADNIISDWENRNPDVDGEAFRAEFDL